MPEGTQASSHVPPACPVRSTSCPGPDCQGSLDADGGAGQPRLPSWGAVLLPGSEQATEPSAGTQGQGPPTGGRPAAPRGPPLHELHSHWEGVPRTTGLQGPSPSSCFTAEGLAYPGSQEPGEV